MPDFVQQFLQHAKTQGSRSNAVTPSAWILATLLGGLAATNAADGPEWLSVTLAGFSGLAVLNFIASYWYFAIKNPDALRSERFTITKLAIEHSAKGDNVVGIVETLDSPLLSPPPSPTEEDEEQ